MGSKTLEMLRETAQAATRGYRNAIWSEEGAPELSSSELARRKRIAVTEAQAYLSETTGWPADQIHYDPLHERTCTPYNREGEPPFYPDELRFGARALLKESDWWTDKLVPPDRLSKIRHPEGTEPDGGAGKMSRFLAAATAGAVGAMAFSSEAGAAMAVETAFEPVGYSPALGLVDELVFVLPRKGEPEAGRLSFLDLLSLAEEQKHEPRLFPVIPDKEKKAAELPTIDWKEDKVEPREPPKIDWREDKEEEEEEKKEEPEEPEEEEKEEDKKEEEPEPEEAKEERKSTLVYRLKRTALFSTSPSSFEWSSEPEKVFVIEEPEEIFEPIPSPGIDRVYPLSLRRVPISQFAEPEVQETARAPLMVAGVYPRAVLVTSTRMSSEVPVAPPLREIARRRELFAPTPPKRKFASAGPEPFDPRLSQLLRRAALKQPITKADLKSAAASRSFTTLGEIYWRVATSGFPEVKAAEEAVPGMSRAKSAIFASVRRLGKMMMLSQPQPLDDVLSLPSGYEDTTESMMKLVSKTVRKIAEEGTQYTVEPAGKPETRGGYSAQKFRVVKKPLFARSFLDVSEFEVVRLTGESGKPQPGKTVGPRRTAPAAPTADTETVARKIAGAVMRLVAPLRTMGLHLPASSAESFKGLRLRRPAAAMSAFGGPLDDAGLSALLTPVAAMFLPTVARRPKQPVAAIEGGKMIAPGLFEIDGGKLTAVIPRRKPGAPVPAVAARESHEVRSKFTPSPGLMVEIVPGETKAVEEAVATRGWKMTLLAPETRKEKSEDGGADVWAIDDAELITTTPLRSRMGGMLYHVGPKMIGTQPAPPRYTPIAGWAEPPVRKSRRPAAVVAEPEAAKPVPVKKVSSDPLKDFDERVLDELMFAMKRRMEVEGEGRGGLN